MAYWHEHGSGVTSGTVSTDQTSNQFLWATNILLGACTQSSITVVVPRPLHRIAEILLLGATPALSLKEEFLMLQDPWKPPLIAQS